MGRTFLLEVYTVSGRRRRKRRQLQYKKTPFVVRPTVRDSPEDLSRPARPSDPPRRPTPGHHSAPRRPASRAVPTDPTTRRDRPHTHSATGRGHHAPAIFQDRNDIILLFRLFCRMHPTGMNLRVYIKRFENGAGQTQSYL